MRRVLCVTAVSVLVGACGGGGSGSAHTATCSPSGTRLAIAAANVAYDKSCLAAPANQAFTITFHNEDSGTPHNVDIVDPSGDSVFRGPIVNGVTTTTYHVRGMKPGLYTFRCDAHPDTMKGTFVVK